MTPEPEDDPMTADDRAARAALWRAYLHHGIAAFSVTARNPNAAEYRRAVLLGWLWEPRPGALAITPQGLDALAPYMPPHPSPDRTDKPNEAAE
jgi:hypothetical protein